VRIVVTAAETGFGPTAALTCFMRWVDTLAEVDLWLDIPRSVSSLVPAALRSVCKSTTIEAPSRVSSLGAYQRRDALLVNFGRAELLNRNDGWLQHIFVDCAGWLNAANHEADFNEHGIALFLEAFPPMEPDLIAPRKTVVRPCIAKRATGVAKRNHVLVCLGGGIFPGVSAAHPMIALTRRLEALASSRVRNTLIFSGLGGTADALVKVYDLDAHRRLTAEAAVVVTVPGLYGVFEALSDDRPVLLLPPTNYTQLIQYTWYRRNGLVPPGLDWCSILGLPEMMPETIPFSEEQRAVKELWSLLTNRSTTKIIAEHTVEAISAVVAGKNPYSYEIGRTLVCRYLGDGRPSLESKLEGIVFGTST
jgi:hypothetical protein